MERAATSYVILFSFVIKTNHTANLAVERELSVLDLVARLVTLRICRYPVLVLTILRGFRSA